MMVLIDPLLKPKASYGFLAEITLCGEEEVFIGNNY